MHMCVLWLLLLLFYQEATEAIKGVLGDYYMKDDTPVWTALWHSWTHCTYVDDSSDYVLYKNKHSAKSD